MLVDTSRADAWTVYEPCGQADPYYFRGTDLLQDGALGGRLRAAREFRRGLIGWKWHQNKNASRKEAGSRMGMPSNDPSARR